MGISRSGNPLARRRWGVQKGGLIVYRPQRRRRQQRGGSFASFLGLNNIGSRSIDRAFDRVDRLSPRLISQLGDELRRSGVVLTDNAINKLIDIPANRIKGVVNRNITQPIARTKASIRRQLQTGVNKAKAIKKILTGSGIHRRRSVPRKRRRRGQSGGFLPMLIPIAKVLGPMIMSEVAGIALKKFIKK